LLAAGPVSPTIGRVRFLDLGAFAGALVFGGLYVSAAGEESDARAALGLTALGMASGLGTAWFLTDGMKPDRGAKAQGPRAGDFTTSLAPTQGGLMLGVNGWL
jgi:hypothetical protein